MDPKRRSGPIYFFRSLNLIYCCIYYIRYILLHILHACTEYSVHTEASESLEVFCEGVKSFHPGFSRFTDSGQNGKVFREMVFRRWQRFYVRVLTVPLLRRGPGDAAAIEPVAQGDVYPKTKTGTILLSPGGGAQKYCSYGHDATIRRSWLAT